MLEIFTMIEGSPLGAYLQERIAPSDHTFDDVTDLRIQGEVKETTASEDEEWRTFESTGFRTWTFTFSDGTTKDIRFHETDLPQKVTI